ncbi:hypothetical protein HPP92_016853 [Vanilla planifolia]|uniref:Homeobox-leucine zipper protein n=1 Tax=Vanilla planifolia TaxID=51239 RepID=A0A835UQH1_VANPL|nr:hypothetical protein HPP92_016853 [Vanilla planifolia]
MASTPFLHPNSILQLHNSYEEDPTNPRETEEGYLSDDCSPQGGKKRRLNAEQVRTLEKSFDLGNKLEAERKLRLAEDLGLQPRQIAIWFQNRRARWKAKQLEKDYELLKRQFKELKAENDALLCHNKKLYDEIMALKGKEASELLEPINLNKGTEGSCSNKSENSSEINLDISRPTTAAGAASAAAGPVHITTKACHCSLPLQSLSTPVINRSKSELGITNGRFGNFLGGLENRAAHWPWPDRHNHH